MRSPDGVTLQVEEVGPRDAPTIVFVHGLGFSHEVWHRQLESSLASRFHLVAYDLRGHGKSSRPSDPLAYEDGLRWGEDLAAVLQATTRPGERAIVVGWSLGGLPIVEYVRAHGDERLADAVFVDVVTRFAPELFTKTNLTYVAPLTSEDDAARKAATEAFVGQCTITPLSRAELSIYERSGHAPFLDETERFDQQLASFAEKTSAK